MSSSVLSIYLVDLFHSDVSVLDVVPLNLGYIASALQETFQHKVKFQIFKYPHKFIKALNKNTPDIIAFSNYTWNHQLHIFFANYIKKTIKPQPIIIMGGPNIRFDEDGMRAFCQKNSSIDVYIPLEGETPLTLFVKGFIGKTYSSIREYFNENGLVKGCFLNIPDYKFIPVDKSCRDSLNYDSPYLNGILDEFIKDQNLVPIFETNRGCPYRCAFCAWGISALKKIKKRDYSTVIDEFRYVADNSAGQMIWFFANANFGLSKHDLSYAKEIKKISDEYGYPRKVNLNWTKNSSKRIQDIVYVLKGMVPAQIALQSTDEKVLANMGRKNLKENEVKKFIDEYRRIDSLIFTDILVGFGGETLESHYNTLRSVFSMEFDSISINNIRVLPGVLMETDEERSKHGYITKFRFIPNSYGFYDNQFVFEIEEGLRANNNFSEKEMNNLKRIHFLVYILWNSSYARDLLKLGMKFGINPLDAILELCSKKSEKKFHNVLDQLHIEAEAEWFETETEIKKFYTKSDNYNRFINNDKPVEKLIWKYFAIFISDKILLKELINSLCTSLFKGKNLSKETIKLIKNLTFDKMMLSFSKNASLYKEREYYAPESELMLLADLDFLDSNAIINGKYLVKFNYDSVKFQDVKSYLRKHNYKKNPISAFSAVLQNFPTDVFSYKT